MRRHALGILLTALAMTYAGASVAQDAVQQTPPELRDFRLDQPRPQADPTPPTAEPVAPPPAVRTVPSAVPEPSAPPPTTTTPRRAQPRQTPSTQPATPVADEPSAPVVPVGGSATASEIRPVPVEPQPGNAAPPPKPDASADDEGNTGIIVSVVGGFIFLVLFAFFWRRRHRETGTADVSDTESTTEVADAVPPVARKIEKPAIAPPILPQSPLPPTAMAQSAELSMAFVPEKATISFTTLTVKGQLHIANQGKAVANGMQLRAVLLSASNQQTAAMESFFGDPAQVPPTDLGESQPGEKLALALELSVPLSEMQSFPLGDQRLLVPILIATLSYTDDKGAPAQARLACMIGREAQPPKPKMGPLRLDKGPRSFAPLGQRPVHS